MSRWAPGFAPFVAAKALESWQDNSWSDSRLYAGKNTQKNPVVDEKDLIDGYAVAR